MFIKTEIEDVIIFEPRLFEDKRGFFFESYNKKSFSDNNIHADFIQDNESFSRYGTIRGLHFQKGDKAQAKLVKVNKGKILDVAVDLRKDSPTYGKHVAVELSCENKRALYIPRGFAHGFSVLSDDAVVSYKCDNGYCFESESGIRFDDERLGIDWCIDMNRATFSEKDSNLGSFDDYDKGPVF